MKLELHEHREQSELPMQPYDRWIAPNGQCMAEFRRQGANFLLRFPEQADFLISCDQDPAEDSVEGWPTPACDPQSVMNLYHNAIVPILGNHRGGLFLHGSAVRIDREGQAPGAIAFLGLSRGGKTTLAGSFAKAGYPFLTEDVIDLELRGDSYLLQPKRSKLRLFADSARHLLGKGTQIQDEDRKQDVVADGALPFAKDAVPLRQIYVLGNDHAAPLSIRQLSLQEALVGLMPHSFVLDVEDKQRLAGHFARLADLSRDIGCYALDYRRDYAELPEVQRAILDCFDSAHA